MFHLLELLCLNSLKHDVFWSLNCLSVYQAHLNQGRMKHRTSMAHTLGVECLNVGTLGSRFSVIWFSATTEVTDQEWALRSALLIFFLIPLSPFHSAVFSVLTDTHACVSLLFLSQENATIVRLCIGITVGNNNFPCQLAEEMAVSFYSTPIYTSRSEGNLSLWKRPAAWTEGRHVAAEQQSDQLVRMCSTEHSPGCEDNFWMPWRTYSIWNCVSEYTKWG